MEAIVNIDPSETRPCRLQNVPIKLLSEEQKAIVREYRSKYYRDKRSQLLLSMLKPYELSTKEKQVLSAYPTIAEKHKLYEEKKLEFEEFLSKSLTVTK